MTYDHYNAKLGKLEHVNTFLVTILVIVESKTN